MATTFEPSSSWQEIPEDAVCPPGLDYRMDMPTGKNYARIPQPKPEAPTSDTSRLEAALYYAENLWPVFPLYEIGIDGKCTCGKPECSSPGKHPRTQYGLDDATIDPEIIRQWWGRWPEANIGGRTGSLSNRDVLDVDPRHGGKDSLLNLESTHGKLPFTQTQLTGGGGEHRVFKYSGQSIRNTTNFVPGLDIRGEGGYIVLAPSNHISGNIYEWEVSSSPDLVGLASMPTWILDLLKAPKSPKPIDDSQPDDDQEIPQGSRNSELTRLAGFLRNARASEEEIYALISTRNQKKCKPPLPESEVRTIAHSVFRYAVNSKPAASQDPETLFNQAVQAPTKDRLDFVQKLALAIVQKNEVASIWTQRVKDAGLCSVGVFKAMIEEAKQSGSRKLSDSDIADRWIENAPKTVYGLGEWRRYEGGVWPEVNGDVIRGEVESILKYAQLEGMKYTSQTVSSVTELIRLRVKVDDRLWDQDPDLLPCQNGVLHIPTMVLRDHNPENYFTFRLTYDYDPEAYPETWIRFLDSTFDDDGTKNFLQEFTGYSLTTDTRYEIAVWLQGVRGSGKSTCITGMQTVVGKRAAILSLSNIEQSHFALAGVEGKTLLTATEQPATYIQQSHILNALISGEPLVIEKKYQAPREYRPFAKIVWAMNDLPRVPDSGNGLFRRVKVIEFPKLDPSKIDERMKEAISKEGSGILIWALVGLQRLRARGKFLIPEKVQQAVDEFERSNNIPGVFVDNVCELGANYEMKSSVLYNFYTTWCADNGHKAESSTRLAQSWRDMGFTKERRNDGVYLHGLRIK